MPNIELSHEQTADLRQRLQNSERRRLQSSIRGVNFWLIAGVFVSVVLLVINAAQAYWALSMLSGLATSSLFWTIVTGLIAVCLIVAANVVSVQFGGLGGFGKIAALALLCALMGFSIFTSALHLSFSIEGGYQASAKTTEGYQHAKAAYDRAVASLEAVEESARLADQKGDTASAGYIRRKQVAPAQATVDKAAADMEKAADSGEQGAIGAVLTEIAGWFGLTPTEFSTRFSIFVVILMELTRIFITAAAAVAIYRAIGDMEDENTQSGEDWSEPQRRQAANDDEGEDEEETEYHEQQDDQGDHNNAPRKKRTAAYQRKLAQVRTGVLSGKLSSLGRKAIKDFCNCGDDVANSIQADLVEEGLAERATSGRLKIAA